MSVTAPPVPRSIVIASTGAAAGCLLATTGVGISWLLIPSVVAGTCTILFGAHLGLSQRSIITCFLLIFVPLTFYCYTFMRASSPSPLDLSRYAGRPVVFQAEVIAEQSSKLSSQKRFILSVRRLLCPSNQPLDGRTLLKILQINRIPSGGAEKTGHSSQAPAQSTAIASTVKQFQAGDVVIVHARIGLPRQPVQPWQFDARAFLARQGIFSVATAKTNMVRRVSNTDEDHGILSMPRSIWRLCDSQADGIRQRLVAIHEANLGAELGDLLCSMVLGDRAVSPDASIEDSFRQVGLSYILAASGFNLTIVTAVTYLSLRLIVPSIRLVNAVSFLAMVCFVGIAGASSSIVRAALMCGMVLLAKSFFRSVDIACALAASLMVNLMIDPWSIMDVGLQLSYGATIGIVCSASALSALLYGGGGRVLKWTADTFAVVVTAQASVMPIQLVYFFQAGALFLPANLLVAPLITPLTVLGFASSMLSLLHTSCAGLNAIVDRLCFLIDLSCRLPLEYMLTVVRYLAHSNKLNSDSVSP